MSDGPGSRQPPQSGVERLGAPDPPRLRHRAKNGIPAEPPADGGQAGHIGTGAAASDPARNCAHACGSSGRSGAPSEIRDGARCNDRSPCYRQSEVLLLIERTRESGLEAQVHLSLAGGRAMCGGEQREGSTQDGDGQRQALDGFVPLGSRHPALGRVRAPDEQSPQTRNWHQSVSHGRGRTRHVIVCPVAILPPERASVARPAVASSRGPGGFPVRDRAASCTGRCEPPRCRRGGAAALP